MPPRPPCETADKIEELQKLPLPELRKQWSQLHKLDVPSAVRRDYLVRAIAYRLQEQDGPRLPVSIARRLELAPDQTLSSAKPALDLP